jgi:UDP-N-acetylmuramoyl-L-alanyl-D-glutamate--2,6-diaminopimelate ligase
MVRLEQLLEGVSYQLQGTLPKRVSFTSIEFDSREIKKGSLFVAINGVQVDGHQFIDKAIELGATIVLCEKITAPKENVLYIIVEDSSIALGILARNYYDNPSQKLRLVGITGTNGKTTTATLLYKLFSKLGYKVGLISTVENRIGDRVIPSTHTTPNVLALNELLQQMNVAGCEYAFMEVSSHAIDQERIAGVHFEGAVFTNITHDHLDYHKTFQNYIYAKKKFFDELPKSAFALTNLDDKRGMVMLQNTAAKKVTYALRTMADFKAKVIENSLTGLVMELDGEEFYARLVGGFNAYNLLSVYTTARLLGADKLEVMTALSNLESAEGRFDFWQNKKLGITGIVDYAHTPDALEKVLQTIDKLRTDSEKIITVVGCGGDRDTNKRPIMAKVACNYSQQVILTSDNPRTEDPVAILEQMEAGVPQYATRQTLVITDRRQAIKTACTLAQKGDIILVAGKGHEKYQEIDGVKYPFDDKEELKKALGE